MITTSRIDKDILQDLLIDQHLNYSDAAGILGVSTGSVWRAAKLYGLSIGQGMTHRWSYKEMTPALAYLLGAYLTDGWVNIRQFNLATISVEFRDKVAQCLRECGLPCSLGIKRPGVRSVQDQATVASYCTQFVQWLYAVCEHKDKIPLIINRASDALKLEFLAAVIDGDGHVTKMGAIRIRSSGGWIYDLQDLVGELNIRSNMNQDALLPSGVPYMAVTIRRADYLLAGGTCYINAKRDRLLTAKDTRVRKKGN